MFLQRSDILIYTDVQNYVCVYNTKYKLNGPENKGHSVSEGKEKKRVQDILGDMNNIDYTII